MQSVDQVTFERTNLPKKEEKKDTNAAKSAMVRTADAHNAFPVLRSHERTQAQPYRPFSMAGINDVPALKHTTGLVMLHECFVRASDLLQLQLCHRPLCTQASLRKTWMYVISISIAYTKLQRPQSWSILYCIGLSALAIQHSVALLQPP